jgi:hypothetical protein
VTEYENPTENIGDDIANTQQEKQDAAASIKDSLLGENDDYSLIITTSS